MIIDQSAILLWYCCDYIRSVCEAFWYECEPNLMERIYRFGYAYPWCA